ncbi:preprotein translocase subunit YajC [Microbacterium sp. MEC084]|uniref:preprotein translocase subunit YajC n=1 Tax=Microbacterium sp. MEC084 TaxID=1963027 RepID=UPI00110508FD|nr:preprotein translocase subunit YajC [Microbacterium sp. MEC084]
MDPNLLLLVVLAVLLIWMFFSSRRRQQKMREEQERKAQLMVPGARVMTRSGLFGTLVEYDKDDLSKPARVEIAASSPSCTPRRSTSRRRPRPTRSSTPRTPRRPTSR